MLRSIMSNRRAAWARVAGAVARRRTRLTVQRLEDRTAPALINSFDPVFSENHTGAITMAANTLLRADPRDDDADDAQAGTGNDLNNNDFDMVAVDVDGNATTTNSSSATLTLPAGATVLFAGLYWGAQSSNTARNQVLFNTPAAGGYQTITGAIIGSTGPNYSAFEDVTSLVSAAGSGTYTVGNVKLTTGDVGSAVTGRYAGWSLVVAYRDPNAPPRNLTVFNGYAEVTGSDNNVTATITGFQAPPFGTVRARLGVVAFEGDLGFSGASLELNNTRVRDAVNPIDDFFNSTISRNGAHVASKNPDFQNQLGFDADEVIVDGMIPNNATSATLRFRSSLDQYFPAMAFTEVELFAPQIQLTKTQTDLNGGALNPGDEIEYTVLVRNTDGDPANNVVLRDLIPANATYVPNSLFIDGVSRTDAPGDDTANFDATVGNEVVFRLGTLANATTGGSLLIGASATARFRVRVNANVTSGALVENQAVSTYTGRTTGFNLIAISNEVELPVVAVADLQVTKTVDDSTPNVGDTVTFTVSVQNNGPSRATGIQINDSLPAGLTFVSATPNQGVFNETTRIWHIASIDVGAQATMTLRARVDTTEARTNVATVTKVNQDDPNAANDTGSATVTPGAADLRVVKTVNVARPNVDEVVTFTVTLSNLGTSDASGVRLTDLLPAGLALVSSNASQGTYTPATGVWAVGSLANGASATLTLQARVTSATARTNTAIVSAADQFDPVTGNNTSSATITPLKADLAVTKVVSDASPNIGDFIAYTITLKNLGPDAATGIQLRDRLPAGMSFVSASATQGAYNSVTGIWTVGSLANGASATLVLNAEVTAVAPGTNVATITEADQFDPETANNSASAPLNAQQVDLVIGKTVSNARPNQDEVISFTVSVTNRGPNTATGVTLSDVVPAGLTVLSSDPSQGIYDSATGIWTVGAVTTVTPATLTIQARVVTPAAKLNVASVISLDQPDANPANNSASVSVIPQQADLAVTKSVSDSRPDLGDTIVFTVRVTNNGNSVATGVQLSDTLPAGLTLLSSDPSQGSYNSAAGTWIVGNLANGASATLLLTAEVTTPSAATNTATISALDQFDTIPSNDSASAAITPLQADLVVTKTVDNPTPNVGDIVTFTISVHNNGPDAAQNIQITDELPDGYTLVTVTRSRGTFSATTEVWTIPSLAVGATATLTIRARVDTPTATPNVATITSAATFDPNTANNSDSAGTTVQQADLVVTKAVDNPSPNVGETVTFTVTVTNTGPNTATNVRVNDLLPSGLTFAGATPSQGTYASATGVWTVGTLASGGNATLQLRATVVASGERTNTAAATANQFDPTLANNQASASVVPQQADVVVSKSVNNPSPNVGDTIVFTVTVRNVGPNAATGVVVTDVLPAGLTFNSALPSQGSFDPGTGVWTVGTVMSGGTATLALTVVVAASGAQTNTATVTDADQFDPNPGNNTGSATATPQQADLAISKTVDDPLTPVGDIATYTIILNNNGPNTATGVQVTDPIPVGTTFVSAVAPPGTTYNPLTGVWDVGTIASGAELVLLLSVRVDTAEAALNTATVTASDQFDPNTANNQDTAELDALVSDLQLLKSVDNPSPNVGDIVNFTVTLRNHGPQNATNIVVTDQLPSGLTFVAATPAAGTTFNPTTGQWSVPSLANGGSVTLVIEAVADAATPQVNNAAITAQTEIDSNPNNNTGSATVTPQQTDLAVTKSVDNVRPNVGDLVTFTVTVTNAGPSVATGVQLTDQLPSGLVFQTAVTSQGTYDDLTGVWVVGTLAAGGATAQLTLTALVDSQFTQLNLASVSAVDQPDPNPLNDFSAAVVIPQQSDLRVSKSVDNPQPNVGDTVTFTVTLSNLGNSTATNVTLTDLLPAGLSFVSATPSQGSYDDGTGIWTVGMVTTAEAETLVLEATVTSPNAATNLATVTDADQFDPVTGNNQDDATITPQVADLQVLKSVDDPVPNVGDVVTFTVTLTNLGVDTATGVLLTDLVPAGLTFVSAAPEQGTYDAGTGLWAVGTVDPNDPVRLVLQARVTTTGTFTNTATVSDADQFDPVTANNTASVSLTPSQADLAVTKSVDNAAPNVGDVVTFTVTVTNNGPDAATGVSINDTLPPELALVSATPSEGSYSSASGVWTIGTIPSGGSVTLQLVTRVTGPLATTNTATVATAAEFDPNTANNTGSASIQPPVADLSITKTVDIPKPNVGDTVTFTITVTNNGPDTATGVTVTDFVPPTLRLVSTRAGVGNYNAATGTWNVGTLPSGGSATMEVEAVVESPSAAVNVVAVRSIQFDPNLANNVAEATIVPPQADVVVAKRPSTQTVTVGQTMFFTIDVTNLGPDTATNVVVTDRLPAGLTFVGSQATQGTYDRATGRWTVGTLAPGAMARLRITVRVTSAGSILNRATATLDQFDPVLQNNRAAVSLLSIFPGKGGFLAN